jgi:cell division protein FtsL
LLVTGGRKDNNYYVSGNLAYKEDITREPQQLKHRGKSYNKRWKPLMLVFLSLIMCCFIIMRYTQAVSINHEINTLKKELAQLERENELLNVDLMYKKDLTYIEEYAKEKLGMDYPVKEQIVYVQVPENDVVDTNREVASAEPVKQDQGILSILAKFLD